MAYSSYLYLSDAFGLWQRCDAQQYPVTPKLGKALFGNAVMPSSTQFIPELGKALFGNIVTFSSIHVHLAPSQGWGMALVLLIQPGVEGVVCHLLPHRVPCLVSGRAPRGDVCRSCNLGPAHGRLVPGILVQQTIPRTGVSKITGDPRPFILLGKPGTQHLADAGRLHLLPGSHTTDCSGALSILTRVLFDY